MLADPGCMHCSDARKNAQRDKEHEKDLAKERVRQLKADLEADADAGEEVWQRKLYAGRSAAPSALPFTVQHQVGANCRQIVANNLSPAHTRQIAKHVQSSRLPSITPP